MLLFSENQVGDYDGRGGDLVKVYDPYTFRKFCVVEYLRRRREGGGGCLRLSKMNVRRLWTAPYSFKISFILLVFEKWCRIIFC